MFTKMMKIYTAVFLLILGCASLARAQVCTPAPVGLVSFYSADGNALDSRSRNNGSLIGNTNFVAGKVGQTFNFDGNGDAVDLGNPVSLQLQNFTIEAWIKRASATVVTNDTTTTDGEILAYGINGYGIGFHSNGALYLTKVGVSEVPGFSVTDTNYHHVAVTKSGNSVVFYLDGVASAPMTFSDTFSFTTNLSIAATESTYRASFFGSIDELAIYNRALSASEIQSISNSGTAGKCKPTATVAPSGQVLWLAGDGDARDISGNSSNGTLQNGAGFAVGKVGQGFSFDGVDDQITVPHNANQNTGSQIAIEAWINPTTLPHGATILQKRSASNIGGYVFEPTKQPFGNDNGLQFVISIGGTYSSLQTPANVLTTGVFQHVAATYDGTTMRIYVNGIEVANKAQTGAIDATTDPIVLGRNVTNTSIAFQGAIDEVALYNRALSADEITSIVNAGIAGKLKQTATSGTTATVGDATVTFASSTSRVTQEIPLSPTGLPPLSNIRLLYDVATSAAATNPTVCFNVPSLTTGQFSQAQVYHLEANQWQNRTAGGNTYPTLCTTTLASLSPFAIVANLAPTAASVSVGGRVTTATGRGIFGAQVSLTDSSGETRRVYTNSFGFYRFENVQAGETYVLGVRGKRYQFAASPTVLFVSDEMNDLKFTALP